MSITKNVFRLNEVYDLINTGLWRNFDTSSRFIPGELWVWGRNDGGKLGQNDLIHRSSPVQIPGTQWNDACAGIDHKGARKIDGTLWAWGSNVFGRLGDNTIINKSSPVQIPGTQWGCVAFGGRFSVATKVDRTLWTWGNGDKGQLGISDRTHRSSPVQVPGTTWNKVATGTSHVLATKLDGTLWSWGSNGSGCLGDGTGISKSSAVSTPEIAVWLGSGLDDQTEEFMKYRGGDQKAYRAMERMIAETGESDMDVLEPYTDRAKINYTIGNFLRGAHIENNIDE
jgi:hypothetical protein